jgi:hypothetical protein
MILGLARQNKTADAKGYYNFGTQKKLVPESRILVHQCLNCCYRIPNT